MYYLEKFENGKWWCKHTLNGEWQEFSALKYREKAIELSTKAINKNSVIPDIIDCTDLEPDFIKTLNELVDTQRKPTKKRF